LKTCQDYVQSTLDGSLEEYSGTFPKQGLMRSGRLYPLPTSEHRTSESESSLWHIPTPTQADAVMGDCPPRKAASEPNQGMHAVGLRDWIRWPTATSRDWKDTGENTNYEKIAEKSRLAGVVGGQLNPTWVEWLMGFPPGWTDLGDSATPSSRRSRK
jgi:hypothetical protein